ncbi:MAG: hypothetical protein KTR24_15680 [Saprospiraceae bacterium]|nr:hypothetical protein [Saprospiraceae bacterium]
MKITVKANGGLGNKMRVIASCIALHHTLKVPIHVIWENNWELHCSFDQLFKPIDGLIVVEEPYLKWYNVLKLGMRWRHRSSMQRSADQVIDDADIEHLEEDFDQYVQGNESVFIKTCAAFYGDDSHLSLMLPIDCIQEVIDRRRRHLNGPYLGLHIRRGDNLMSRKVSKLHHFKDAIALALDQEPSTQFYLSTDSRKVAEQIVEWFGPCIHYTASGKNRRKPGNIQAALVDLMVLSGAERIIGSYWSSFSEVAAGYRKIPLEQAGVA